MSKMDPALKKFKEAYQAGRLTLEGKKDIEKQYALYLKNKKRLQKLYPGMIVAYCNGIEYLSANEDELYQKIKKDNPLDQFKVFSAELGPAALWLHKRRFN